MPNEKNVAALRELLFDALLTVPNREPHVMAEWLAARAVLVPSAVTDEQAERLRGCPDPEWPSSEHTRSVDGKRVRDALERIAKGEA